MSAQVIQGHPKAENWKRINKHKWDKVYHRHTRGNIVGCHDVPLEV